MLSVCNSNRMTHPHPFTPFHGYLTMQSRRNLYYLTGLLALTALVVTSAFLMPDVTYKTSTKVTFSGAVGKVIDFFAKRGGAGDGVVQTVYLKGDKMRTDDENHSTIIDLENERFITLDHSGKTYTVMTFDDFARLASEMAEGQQGEDQQTGAASNTEYSFDLKVTPTGERQKIGDYNAERMLMTLTVEAKNTAPAESEEQGMEGTMVIASELWMSKDASWYQEVNAFNQKMAEKMGEVALKSVSGMGQALAAGLAGGSADDPRMKEALAEASKEAAKLDGIQVRNTTHVVLVPPGVTFDQDALFQTEKKEEPRRRGGLGRFARRIAEQAVTGGAAGESNNEENETPGQATLLTTTTDIIETDLSPIPASMFDIPEGYREIQPENN